MSKLSDEIFADLASQLDRDKLATRGAEIIQSGADLIYKNKEYLREDDLPDIDAALDGLAVIIQFIKERIDNDKEMRRNV